MQGRRAVGRLLVVAVLLGLVGGGLALLATSGHLTGNAATPAVLGVSTGLLGSLILWYRPANRMGRLLTATGVLFGLTVLAGGVLESSSLPAGLRQAALAWAWLAGALSVQWILFVLWFPDGRFGSRAWRRFFFIAAGATLAVAVAGYLVSSPGGRLPVLSPVQRAPAGLEGPLGIGSSDPLANLSDVVGVLLPLVALIGLAQRYVRSGILVRQQIKWLLAGTVAAIVGGVIGAPLRSAGGAAHAVGIALFVVSNPLTAAGATVAVLRYRLWEIDLVVSKAVVYGVLWAVLSVVIVVPALATGLLVGGSSALAAVGLALGVTVLFQPARSRLERMVERLVYRNRPRGYALLSRFGQSLKAVAEVGHLAPNLAETVRSGLGVAWAGVWIYVGSEGAGSLRLVGGAGAVDGPSVIIAPSTYANLLSNAAAFLGPSAPDELRVLGDGAPAAIVPLVAAEELVGLLACGQRRGDPLGEVDLEVLGLVGREAALALANLRLEAQLRERLAQIEDQADELRRSRQRLVGAQDDERRRMERNLHDGVQQQLVSLTAQLRRAAIARPADARHFLDQVASDAEEAVFALQEVGRGIFPVVLADQGLPAALRTQASRVPMAIRVEVAPSLSSRRFDPELEAALYFVGLEAMTNAQKHAPDATMGISLRSGQDERVLVLEVHDDGPGFALEGRSLGAGLQNMNDRVAAVGGELTIDTGPGDGTWVRAQAPIPAEVVALSPPPIPGGR